MDSQTTVERSETRWFAFDRVGERNSQRAERASRRLASHPSKDRHAPIYVKQRILVVEDGDSEREALARLFGWNN